MSIQLAGALDCASRGLRVHPVAWKIPILNGWPELATTNIDTIKAWAAEYPGTNWGIACGAGSDVVVADLDIGKNGLESFEELEGRYGRGPDAPVVLTPSGGLHIYFEHPGHFVKSVNGLIAPGIDIKADGGQVVAPGSVHRNGGTYTWNEEMHPDHVPFPPLPTWIEMMLNATPEPVPRPIPMFKTVKVGTFDLDTWIMSHGLDVTGPYTWGNDRGWKFHKCPAAYQHVKDPSDASGAFIVQRPDGKIGAGCYHASCSWGWRELRSAIEPEYATRRRYFDKISTLRSTRGMA